jgi:hypothetical protein
VRAQVADIPPRVMRILVALLGLAGAAFSLAGTALGLCLTH